MTVMAGTSPAMTFEKEWRAYAGRATGGARRMSVTRRLSGCGKNTLSAAAATSSAV